MPGGRIRTIRGAKFRGVPLVYFNSMNGTPHVCIEAVDEHFERSIHVYPLSQTEPDPDYAAMAAADPYRPPQAFSVREVGAAHAENPLELRPFGIDGIDAPIGTILKHLRTTPLPDKWAYCEGGLAPKDMHEMLGSDQLPDFSPADHGSKFCHIIRVSHG